MSKSEYWWCLRLCGDLFLLEDSKGKTKKEIMKEWDLRDDKSIIRIRIEEVEKDRK